MIQDLVQKATTDHKDLTSAYVSAAVAAIILRYVASVAKPGGVDVILACAPSSPHICSSPDRRLTAG